MNKWLRLTALASVAAVCACAQDVAGDWQGTLEAGEARLHLLVHIAAAGAGWQGSLDSVDQGAAGIPVPSIIVKGSGVSFEVPAVHGRYEGKLNAAGVLIEGTWAQGVPLPLNLTRLIPDASSSIEGAWSGNLHAGGVALRTVLHIATAGNGLTATIDSPDQGGYGMAASTVTRTGAALKLKFPSLDAQFDATVYRDPASVAGTRTQRGGALPLVLHRDTGGQRRRPQNPVKPYPYREEEVSYRNQAAAITLGGTLTLPPGKGPFPAVVLITGSGQQDRDESLLGHKPFLVLADYLTRRGIAVLRSDDRGMGKSGGDFAQSTTADFAGDTAAAFSYLQTRPEIDAGRIGLIGHSEGGAIAPMVAARNPRVEFIVLMAGPGVRGADLLPVQNMRLALASGASPEAAQAAASANRELLAMVVDGKDNAAIGKFIRETGTGKAPEAQIEAQVKATLDELRSPWFRYFLTFDPGQALRQVKCPVLALDGEKDTQVDARQNLGAIRRALEQGGNRNFETVELPGLNHLFQTARTGAVSEYGEIEETIAPAVLEKMASWILKQAGAQPPARDPR